MFAACKYLILNKIKANFCETDNKSSHTQAAYEILEYRYWSTDYFFVSIIQFFSICWLEPGG